MKTEGFVGQHEAREALVLSVAGVDRNYADCEFTFADLLLSHTVASRSNV
jgi:hypothetical protein